MNGYEEEAEPVTNVGYFASTWGNLGSLPRHADEYIMCARMDENNLNALLICLYCAKLYLTL